MRILLALAAVTAALAGLSAASAATRDFPATGFTQVDLKAAADVTIRTGPFAVHADGDPALVDPLLAEVHDGVLVLTYKPHTVVHSHGTLHLAITMPRTTSVAIGGAGKIDLQTGSGPAFGASIGGAGTITVGAVHVERTVLAISGAGKIAIAGDTGSLDAHASGVGSIDAAALTARTGQVSVSGTGQVHARIDGPVAVALSGIGGVTIDGHPRCTVSKSGLGTVHCG